MKPQGVMGIYNDMDSAVGAIHALKPKYANLSVLSPAPHHELEHALDQGPSNVRWFTLVGGLTGLLSAIGLTTWTSADWPLVTGGKPIVISPGYLVIMFELTVLFAALFTVAGFIALSRLPHTRLRVGYDERVSDASIGIWIPVNQGGVDAAAQALKQTGAEDVRIESR